jgi:DNA-binding PadR family transcriptional regulator
MARTYLSFSATVILQAVANGYPYGFDIMDTTGLPAGTVYPALRRLEDMAYVVSKWEKPEVAQREQRPARKYYEMTAEGEEVLAEALKRYRALQPAPRKARQIKPSREHEEAGQASSLAGLADQPNCSGTLPIGLEKGMGSRTQSSRVDLKPARPDRREGMAGFDSAKSGVVLGCACDAAAAPGGRNHAGFALRLSLVAPA